MDHYDAGQPLPKVILHHRANMTQNKYVKISINSFFISIQSAQTNTSRRYIYAIPST